MTKEALPDTHQDHYSKTILGFWLYLLTDFVLFATILAAYFVLRKSTFGGPSAEDLLPISFVFIQTIFLLLTSFTVGLGGTYLHIGNRKKTALCFGSAFVLGSVFFAMQICGMMDLIEKGFDWQKSAFLSAYYTVIGTHALHVIFALLWTVLLLPLLWTRVYSSSRLRFTALRMFWQFINVIWIAIFTIIYLMGIS